MSDFVSMGDIWQRRGFMNMPERFRNALFAGLQTAPLADPQAGRQSVADRFTAACNRWIAEARLSEEQTCWSKIRPMLPEMLAPHPGYRPTITEVEWDLSLLGTGTVRLRAQRLTEARILWLYENYAYAVFWALLYHVESEYLRRPRLILKELGLHNLQWNLTGCVQVVSSVGFELALYERLLGMHSDQALQRQHHRDNVVNRSGLSAAEQLERPELFRQAIAYLLRNTIEEGILPFLEA